ncbi:MAG TPA: glucose 1-dehydrogenase [Kofleriaceae bacterium]|jgi:NAD(P)-dependent dehydrogenase (short-subunit alcohol dehydrogenase family)|nr:glucose 1-dehydrogenase [Kofleriaceae bacterium]
MSKLLQGKVALVTGAGSGIGREIADRLGGEGARIVVADVDDKGGNETIARLRDRGIEAIYVHADSSKPADNEAVVAAGLKAFGGLDIAVNNAGIGGPSAPVGEYPIDGWDKVIAINLSGVFYGMRYQLPAMAARGGGSIINIASVLGQVGFRNSSAYVAAKHGVVGLTKNAALEYGPQKIRVNAVGPGFIKTPLLEKNLTPEAMKTLEGMHALGRLGESTEVAELVTWLASDRASFVTGAYYAADGGYLAQ